MCGEIKYLEKYSVASSPSRDYYGIKVLRGEVILYLWRISHGPHRAPIVRSVNFFEFNQDKALQDDIGRGFGERLLEHVKNIVVGKKTLLTLPKSLLDRLSRHLTYIDIVNLSSVSYAAHEIFNDNSLWEALYRRRKIGKITKVESDYAMAHGWKQLLKEQHAQLLLADKQISRSTSKQGTLQRQQETKSSSRATKVTPQTSISSMNNGSKKPQEIKKKILPSGVAKKSLDARISSSTTAFGCGKNEIPDRRLFGTKSPSSTSQRTAKPPKEQSPPLKPDVKRERNKISVDNAKKTESKSSLRSTNVQKPSNNAGKKDPTVPRLAEDKNKSASMKPDVSRNVTSGKNESSAIRRDRAKCQTSAKPKAKKFGPSKSTILSSDKALLNDVTAMKDDSFDLADLIEASMKNIRSPRSIFDCDFSCLDLKSPGAGDSTINLACQNQNRIETLRNRKATRTNVALDRLSEKSEPATGKSTDSAANEAEFEKSDDMAKYTNAQLEKMKSSLATDLAAVGDEGEKIVDRFSDALNRFSASRLDEFETKMADCGEPFVEERGSWKFLGAEESSRRRDDIGRNYLTAFNRLEEFGAFKSRQAGGKRRPDGRK